MLVECGSRATPPESLFEGIDFEIMTDEIQRVSLRSQCVEDAIHFLRRHDLVQENVTARVEMERSGE